MLHPSPLNVVLLISVCVIILSYLQQEHNRAGLPLVDIVVDPYLVSRLRPHQKDGVIFLYECVMGLRGYQGNGAILA